MLLSGDAHPGYLIERKQHAQIPRREHHDDNEHRSQRPGGGLLNTYDQLLQAKSPASAVTTPAHLVETDTFNSWREFSEGSVGR